MIAARPRELWSHRVGPHRYWCPTHVTPEAGAWLVYVQRDTTTHRACCYGASRLVRFELSTGTIAVGTAEDLVRNGWPPEWSLPAKRSLEAALREALARRAA